MRSVLFKCHGVVLAKFDIYLFSFKKFQYLQYNIWSLSSFPQIKEILIYFKHKI